jgi:hypothetical protein
MSEMTEVQNGYRYQLLGEEAQQQMVRASLFELEKHHFETELNIQINGPEHLMTFEDGSSQTLKDRLAMFEAKIEKLREQYQDML